jgi:3'-phosphoadenosine 5'-phosphosulfate sulfotransferase (PAPS reductase)/FAD synthetase
MKQDELKMLQALPLDIKVGKSKLRIREWLEYHGRDKVYISFSGGKDSTVLACLVREVEFEMFGDNTIPLVFSDTGLEFPELREFAFKQKNLVVVRPKLNFTEVIKRYGYPVIAKNTSANIYKLKNNNLSERYRNYLLNGDERGSYGTVPKKWQRLIDSDFNIGAGCCDVMKKRPLHKYEKDTGRSAPMTGEMAEESRLRQKQYLQYGCNAFNRGKGFKSTPLGFWTQNDILEYITINKIEIASVYGDIIIKDYRELPNGNKLPIYQTTGENRTGCVFCLYGIQFEKDENRIQKLATTHPKLYDYCIRGGKYDEEGQWIPYQGLGLAHVMDELNIEWRVKNGDED